MIKFDYLVRTLINYLVKTFIDARIDNYVKFYGLKLRKFGLNNNNKETKIVFDII